MVGGDDLKELVECGGRWGEWNEGMGEMGDDGFGVVDGLGVNEWGEGCMVGGVVEDKMRD